MTKVKTLIALVAMVTMVGAASVAHGAAQGAVTVQGTVDTVLTVNPCTAAAWTIAIDAQSSQTCAATYSSNQVAGYDLTFVAADSYMDSIAPLTPDTDTISVLTGVTCTAQAAECFSYEFDSGEAAGTYGTGLNGTVDSNQDDVPTTNFVVYTSAASDDADGEDYTYTFYAYAEGSTEAGTYQLDTGTLTVASQ